MAQKSKRKPKPDTLALDDPRWMPIREAHKRINEVVDHPFLAARDLLAAIETEKVKSMRRAVIPSLEGYERQLNERDYWVNFFINKEGEVVRHDDQLTAVTDLVFYVWGPDITKHWSNITKPSPEGKGNLAADDDGDVSTIERRKPGPQARHQWPTVIARELIRRAKAGEKDPTAAQLAQFCLNKWDWQPDISALQRLLKQLLG